MDRLVAMQSFVRTVERDSFAAAAAANGLSPAMVGNHVRFLEAQLGAPLLHRNTRRQRITEFGRSYYERCRAILLEIEVAEASAGAMLAVPRGLARVTSPLSFGTTVLPRIVAGYLQRHREVRVDLVLGDHRLDLLTDRLDAAIRVGTLPDCALPPMSLLSAHRRHTWPRTAPRAPRPSWRRTSASTSSTRSRTFGAPAGQTGMPPYPRRDTLL